MVSAAATLPFAERGLDRLPSSSGTPKVRPDFSSSASMFCVYTRRRRRRSSRTRRNRWKAVGWAASDSVESCAIIWQNNEVVSSDYMHSMSSSTLREIGHRASDTEKSALHVIELAMALSSRGRGKLNPHTVPFKVPATHSVVSLEDTALVAMCKVLRIAGSGHGACVWQSSMRRTARRRCEGLRQRWIATTMTTSAASSTARDRTHVEHRCIKQVLPRTERRMVFLQRLKQALRRSEVRDAGLDRDTSTCSTAFSDPTAHQGRT